MCSHVASLYTFRYDLETLTWCYCTRTSHEIVRFMGVPCRKELINGSENFVEDVRGAVMSNNLVERLV